MRDDWLKNLMEAFDRFVSEHSVFREIYAFLYEGMAQAAVFKASSVDEARAFLDVHPVDTMFIDMKPRWKRSQNETTDSDRSVVGYAAIGAPRRALHAKGVGR